MGSAGRTGTIEANAQDDLRRFLRLSEVAQIVGVGRSTVYRWAHAGHLPVIRRAGGMYVPRKALEAFLAAEAEAALENLQPETKRSPSGDPAVGAQRRSAP